MQQLLLLLSGEHVEQDMIHFVMSSVYTVNVNEKWHFANMFRLKMFCSCTYVFACNLCVLCQTLVKERMSCRRGNGGEHAANTTLDAIGQFSSHALYVHVTVPVLLFLCCCKISSKNICNWSGGCTGKATQLLAPPVNAVQVGVIFDWFSSCATSVSVSASSSLNNLQCYVLSMSHLVLCPFGFGEFHPYICCQVDTPICPHCWQPVFGS